MSNYSPKSPKNSLKPSILKVQGHSRSSTLTLLRSSSPVLVMISSMFVPICNHFHTRQANSGRIMSFKGVLLFLPLFRGDPLHPVSQNTRDCRLCHMVKNQNLYLTWSLISTDTKTDGQTNRITVANTRYS